VSQSWWRLPGPGEFIRRAADELREGRNLVLSLPRHLPDGLAEALRRELFSDYEVGSWRLFDTIPENGSSPARQVADCFLRSVPPGPVDASSLAHHDDLAGHIIWLDGLTADNWPSWRDFLAEYAHACRSRPLLSRTVFVAALVGSVASTRPPEDVALAVRPWAGVVEALDQMLYVSGLLRDRPMPALRRELIVSVIAGLALWDPAVSDALAGLPLEEVLRPGEVLVGVARFRGWKSLLDDQDACRHEGMVDCFAGRDQVHSSVLAGAQDTDSADELERRVWSAQVGVLLPFVEARRRELLERLDGQLSGPFRFDNGLVVQDPRDLEIGQIEYQLRRRGCKVPPVVSVLKHIRNCLAHLEVVGSDLLESSDLLKPL
jgi:hypothetical protein